MEGPSLGNGFCVFSPAGKLTFIPGPELDPALKKEGGISRSFHDLAGAVAPPLADKSGLLCMTSNNASSCVLALGSSITDVFLSSPAADPSAPLSLMMMAVYRTLVCWFES